MYGIFVPRTHATMYLVGVKVDLFLAETFADGRGGAPYPL